MGPTRPGTLLGPNAVRIPAHGRNAPIQPARAMRQSATSLILDSGGNPYRLPRDPLQKADRGRVEEVYKDLPIQPLELEWTVADVRQAITEHALGQFFRSGALIEAMQGNDRIISALGSRVGALLGLDEVYTGAEADTDSACLDAWKTAWPSCHAPPDQGDTLDEIRRTALMGGLHVSELVWDTEHESGLWQPFLKPWSLQNIYFDIGRRTLVAIAEDGCIDIVPGNGRWFVHAPTGVYRGYINGLVRALSLPWLLHGFGRRDWARYSERHGMPILLAKVPQMADSEDKKRFEEDLVTMGSEAIAVLPQGLDGEYFDLDLLEAAAQSWEGFDRLIIRAENAITIAIQWQNLTTEVKEGSEAAARVHGDVKQSAVELDDRALAQDVQQQIGRPFALYNFGDARKAPHTHRDVEALDDKVENCQALESFSRALAALRQANTPVDVPALAKEYRIKLPLVAGDGEKSLAPIFAYHLGAKMVTRNEARARVDLPPIDGPAGEELLGAETGGEAAAE